jgi:2-oxoglutarate dehydrogenase E2 component (dihydrolipoamide succinyltransferase)
MATPVLMPQMGESIAEGTIVRWIKKVGDAVDRDEPLFEISTDKVDAEIPSPAAGVLTEITVHEGETVAVNSVVGTIGGAVAAEPPRPPAPPQAQPDGAPAASTPAARAAIDAAAAAGPARSAAPAPDSPDGARRQRSSPLVRRIAREHNVDISQLHGSGVGGRVTKLDILGYLEDGRGKAVGAGAGTAPHVPPAAVVAAAGDEIKPLSVMRRKIAEHMILSRRTSAHVHTVFHVNFSTVDRLRQQKKAEYEDRGVKLTYMAFIAKSVIDALRAFPIVNASLDGNNVVYRKAINLGIAVALDTGLIVPVIKGADEKNLLGLSRAIAALADRARAKQLSPDDVHDGTFTITNPGQSGAQFGMPIINQPQVAILGVGTIEKRPVVENDALAIRTMAYLTLGFDHRLIDGAVADQFVAAIKHQLEHFDPNQV